MPFIVAGDVGGTNSRFMLHTVSCDMRSLKGHKAPGEKVFSKEYTNDGVGEFIDQLRRFLSDAECSSPPVVACIAIAGPVVEDRVTMTNREWVIDGREIERQLGIKSVRLVNDFVAAGYGLLTLDVDTECATLHKGKRIAGAPIACLGAGTGLGETYLTCPIGRGSGMDYDCFPSEGGHAELAPRNDLDYRMIRHITETLDITRCSVERVVSGKGLENVYNFLADEFPERVNAQVHLEIKGGGDQKGKIIAENSQQEGSLCEQAMNIWAEHYGAEAGVQALKYIPHGGLFLAGGLTPKNLDLLQRGGADGVFLRALFAKGRVSPILKDIPIYAVLKEDIGQRGAHLVAFKLFLREDTEAMVTRNHVWSLTRLGAVATFAALVGVALGRIASAASH